MTRSTPEDPIQNGQTLVTQYTFLDRTSGEPLLISGPITFEVKAQGQAIVTGTGTLSSDGTDGVALASLPFSVPSSVFSAAARVIRVNWQFFADGVPGQPMVEYVAPNVHDLAAGSSLVIQEE